MISVIINTARRSYSMTGLPNKHHLEYTCEALAAQQYTDFEVIVADLLQEQRIGEGYPWWKPLDGVAPVFHVPVRSTPFVDRGYVAISTTKNSGALYGTGDLFVFLDDCTFPPQNALRKYAEWHTKGYFMAGLHARLIGNEYSALDARFRILDKLDTNVVNDRLIATYGYVSCSRDAFYKLNGFDEMFDGSRQLEDMDFGERLQLADYRLVLDREGVIHEQEHLRIAPYPDDYDTARERTIDKVWGPNLKCNGTWIFMKQDQRIGADRYLANHRKLTDAEWRFLGGTGEVCPYRVFDPVGNGYCGRHGPPPAHPGSWVPGTAPPCNWHENRVEAHMVLPDAQLYKDIEPIWFANEAVSCMMKKEDYRVC